MSNSVAPSPISSSGVKRPAASGAAARGCAARWATAVTISATPALSSAPSSVSPLEVTMSWPRLAGQLGHRRRVEPRAARAAARSRRRRSRGGRSARRRAPGASGLVSMCAISPIAGRRHSAPGGRQRRHRRIRCRRGRIGDPRRVQLGDQQPAEIELARRAGRAGALVAGLGVDPHVALEALQQVGGQRLGEG